MDQKSKINKFFSLLAIVACLMEMPSKFDVYNTAGFASDSASEFVFYSSQHKPYAQILVF